MAAISVPNRPFSSELITGLALPDGIFETTIGLQRVNAHFKNQGASPSPSVNIYVESVSDPGIVITPQTYTTSMAAGAAQLFYWNADFSAATPGTQYISFIADDGVHRTRIIKKIFVTRVTFNPATKIFRAETPEGTMEVGFREFFGPKGVCCCGAKRGQQDGATNEGESFLNVIREFSGKRDPNFHLCLRQYLIKDVEMVVAPQPPFPGQYGDLPFQDPWWKVVLLIIAALLAIAAAIAEAIGGTGDLTVSGSSDGGVDDSSGCCGLSVSGGGTSYVAAGLLAAAAAVATAAALSDVRDPFRRGEDNTVPAAGELTTGERVRAKISYPEPVALGKPFAITTDWTYTRITTGASYNYSVSETNNNIHVVSEYDINAPNVVRVYKREPWVVRAQFKDAKGTLFRGEQLFVQCFLIGPAGQLRSFVLQDGGISPDATSNDGIYTGVYQFALEEQPDPRGIWTYFVIAQDVNSAQPDMVPEKAAQIIGGMVLTHQLTVDFSGGTCPFVPDGHVHVV